MNQTPSTSRERYDRNECRRVAASLRLIVFDFDGVFTDNSVYVMGDGQEAVRCSRFDGFGIRLLEEAGLDSFILSKETAPVVVKRAEKLKIKCHHGVDNKKAFLSDQLGQMGLAWSQVCYMGNDINDIECLKASGFAVVVCDAHASVFPHSHYTTQTRGGEGAVRELCEFITQLRADCI